MKSKLFALVAACMLLTTTSYAHVMNVQNTFEDIALTEAADEIVMLSSLGIVSIVDHHALYRPQDVLTKEELAVWVAKYNGFEGTKEVLADVALQQKLVTELQGDATYNDVNAAFFHNDLALQNGDETLTREQFALFMFEHLQSEVNGQTLLQKAGYSVGPTGIVEKVERIQKTNAAGEEKNVYMLTISGQRYELGQHPRAFAQTTDPQVWEGEHIAESWYGPNVQGDHHVLTENEEQALQMIVLGDEPFIGQTVEKPEKIEVDLEQALMLEEPVADKKKATFNWLYIVVGFIVGITGFVVIRRMKK